MSTNLTPQQIGQRINELRKKKGLSQEELAKCINISRTSLTQIEAGNRNLSLSEFQQLSHVFGFSLDHFMSADFNKTDIVEEEQAEYKKTDEMRISIPTMNVNKFKNVLLYILEKCAGKPNVGETVLYKLLYFADFNYYEIYEEHLSGARYRKLPYGPVPQKLDTIIEQMIKKVQLQRIKTDYHGFAQTRYLPLIKADLTLLKASEKEVIDKVLEQMSDWSATMLSNYSHEDLPWKVTEMNDFIDYEFAFYRRPPYTVRVYEEDEQDNI